MIYGYFLDSPLDLGLQLDTLVWREDSQDKTAIFLTEKID